jgi:hypothetical protein
MTNCDDVKILEAKWCLSLGRRFRAICDRNASVAAGLSGEHEGSCTDDGSFKLAVWQARGISIKITKLGSGVEGEQSRITLTPTNKTTPL